jgi:hypothetical protein
MTIEGGPRRILANLLAEDQLAGRRSSPPRTVLETVARMAPLLRAFAHEDDHLWSPAPIDPGSVPEIPGLPLPIFESGPLHDLPPAGDVLAWCETSEAAAHRGGARAEIGFSWDEPLHEIVWKLPTPPPAVAAAVHHRAFCLGVAEDLGCALPGARMVDSMAALDRVLPTAPPAWIVKAPLSASGRSRYIERHGPALIDPKSRRTIERLFELHGPLLFEPWMDRTEDFGVSALLGGSELRIVGIHHQKVDRKGQFVGIDLHPDLSAEDRHQLLNTTEAVAAALRSAGYVGPFGIDAWRYRRPDGAVVLNPLGEINARMTFGLVAWATAERLSSIDPQ